MSNAGGDFRDAAALESIEMVGPEIVVPPLELGVSLCHPCEDPPALWRPQLNTLAALVLGFAGLGAGGILAATSSGSGSSSGSGDWASLLIAGACSLFGFTALFGGIFLNRGWVRRQLGDRLYGSLGDGSEVKPRRVDVEDTATFSKLKICPDDQGVLFLDAQQQAVLIEGLRYRYTIFHDDLIELNQVRGGSSLGIEITYRVGRETLSIVVGQQDNLRHELRKQTIGAKTAPLLKELRSTFGVVHDIGD